MKKVFSFLAWAIFLCLFFLIFLTLAVLSGKSLIWAVVLWFGFIIIFYLLVQLALLIHREKLFSRIFRRAGLSRTERIFVGRWKKGIRILKKMGRRGKPLPWFVLTGTQKGQSTLLASVSATGVEGRHFAPTRTLQWRFFKTAAFLELSGHFLELKNTLTVGWHRMVLRQRFSPLPAGVVVCVSTAELRDGAEIEIAAQRVRALLAPLLQKVKRRLPLYLVITECDELPGFTEWATVLSPAQRQQALGGNIECYDPECLNAVFVPLSAGLNNARMSMFSGNTPDIHTPNLLAFPQRLLELQPFLQRYISTLCEKDNYSVSGVPGGVWFTARTQEEGSVGGTLFFSELLAETLPVAGRGREMEYLSDFRGYIRRWGIQSTAALLVLLLLISGINTLALISATKGAGVQGLLLLEESYRQPLRYLPFTKIIRYRQSLLENAIVETSLAYGVDSRQVTEQYRDLFDKAEPAGQRTLILDLAQAIGTKQAMLEGASLERLLQLPTISPLLTMTGSETAVSSTESMVVQRTLLQGSGGDRQISDLRQLLRSLIERDPQWGWLLAPAPDLAGINPGDFFPGTGDEHGLSSTWTLQGTQYIRGWIAEVRSAAGKGVALPVLDNFEKQHAEMRQSAWLKFTLWLSQQPTPSWRRDQWTDVLLDIAAGSGPVMRVFRQANEQLADIPDKETTPWLRQVRQLVDLQATSVSGVLAQKVSHGKNRIHQDLFAWLGVKKETASMGTSAAQVKNWNEWQKSLRLAVSAALNASENSAELTDGLFSPEGGNEKNPLQALNLPFVELRKSLNAREGEPEIDAVWSLFSREKQLMIAYGMYRTGCWLQQQWQTSVMFPLEKNAQRLDYPAQKAQASQYLSAFMRGPAKSVLAAGQQGVVSGAFEGQSLALTAPFLHLVNDVVSPDDLLAMPQRDETRNNDRLSALKEQQKVLEETRQQLEARPLVLTLKSYPATIPGGAQLMPVGTELHLYCDTRQSSLKSMNFGDQAAFHWQPGHCNRVSQIIQFPGFQLEYNYLGDSAWPDFLNNIIGGQHSYSVDDFAEQASILRAQGIKNIMVRYQSGDITPVSQSWRQWQSLTQALEDNREEQQLTGNHRASGPPSGVEGLLSALPVKIAVCDL